jgi:YD repeat-containing protein
MPVVSSMKSARIALALSLVLAALWVAPALASETHQYDPIGRLTDVAYQNGGSLHYTYDANGNVLSVVTSIATAVESGQPRFEFALGRAVPNPGSGPRSIAFSTPARGHVTLRVFDVSGRQVATLVDGDLNAGPHNLRFFTDRWGNGVYYYRLQFAGRTRSGRLIVLR